MGHNSRKESWRAALVPVLASAIAVALLVAPISFFMLNSGVVKSPALCSILPCESAMVNDIPGGEVPATDSKIKAIVPGSIINSLGWTEFADAYIVDLIHNLQHPDNCHDAKLMVVEADESGLLWNFRSIVRALTLGLLLNRTVIPHARRPGGAKWEYAAFDGCKDRHIGCFFKNITSCSIDGMYENPDVRIWQSWDFLCQGECFRRKMADLARDRIVYFTPMNSMYPGSGLEVWPSSLWKEVTGNMDKFLHAMPSDRPRFLASSNAVFMLHAIISKWLFRPHERIMEIQRRILESLPAWSTPLAAVHIRRTDKEAEDPFWREHGHHYRSMSMYIDALGAAQRANGRLWRSVFVMSDSQSAISELSSHISNLTDAPALLYNSFLDRTIIEGAGGHVNVPHEHKRHVQDHFVACVHLTALLSSHVVGTLSSNVFRVIMQLVGAQKRMIQTTQSGPLATSLDGNEGWQG